MFASRGRFTITLENKLLIISVLCLLIRECFVKVILRILFVIQSITAVISYRFGLFSFVESIQALGELGLKSITKFW